MRPSLAAWSLLFVSMLICSGSSARAEWYITQLTHTDSPSTAPLVTYDGTDKLHVFWTESGDVCHQIHDGSEWMPPEVVGQGRKHELVTCRVDDDIFVVWIGPDDRVRFRIWSHGIWSQEEIPPWGGVGAVTSTSVAKVNGPHILWTEIDSGTGRQTVFYSTIAFREPANRGSPWTDPLPLGEINFTWDPMNPSASINVLDPTEDILVSWLEEAGGGGLRTRLWDGSAWGPEETPYDFFGTSVDLDRNPNHPIVYIAAHMLPADCPCGEVFYAHGAPGSWSQAEAIGTGHVPDAEMEWPREVSIHVSASDIPHLVWRHESYDGNLEMFDERLVLAVKSGDWSFEDQIAVSRNIHRPQAATKSMGSPALAWSDDSDGFLQIYLATTEPLSCAPEEGQAPAEFVLRVGPNPTGGALHFSLQADEPGAYHLSIHDVLGRTVYTKQGRTNGSGRIDATWSGLDPRGEPVFTGVYYIQILRGLQAVREQVLVIR